jgi:hypothetical protein
MPELSGRRIALLTHDAGAAFALDPTFYVQHYFTFRLEAVSNSFSGVAHFCIPSCAIRTFITSLRAMSSTLAGSATLEDTDSDAFVSIGLDRLGRATVCGRVGGTHESHSMTFEFLTDQTCIDPLIADLERLLEHEESLDDAS